MHMEYYIDKQAGVSNHGNINQMKQLMIRAKRGEGLGRLYQARGRGVQLALESGFRLGEGARQARTGAPGARGGRR